MAQKKLGTAVIYIIYHSVYSSPAISLLPWYWNTGILGLQNILWYNQYYSAAVPKVLTK